MLIGVPIGILAAERDGVWTPVRVVIDTLQTLPSFVYLMPAVMLFRVGDFTAMIAVVACGGAGSALHGPWPEERRSSPDRGGPRVGCGRSCATAKLRLALPEILLGLNQTVMFALSMLVITTRSSNPGPGAGGLHRPDQGRPGARAVAGLAVAFIAIIAGQ